jgi:electron transfer flavoprotein alpha subunit
VTERVLYLALGTGEAAGLSVVARDLAGANGSVAALAYSTDLSPSENPPADRVYHATSSGFDPSRSDHLGAAVGAGARAFQASIVLSGPTKLEREALARAGALLGGPTVTGVRSTHLGPECLEVSRDLLSGNATAVERISSRPALLSLSTIPEGPEVRSGSTRPPERVPISAELPSYHFVRISRKPRPAGDVNLEAADRIVSVGRGLQKREDLSVVNALATVLGAAVGCTRPVAAESGWLSDDHWVGLTGHRVRPTLYVAIGISGAAQHLVGMRDSKIVVAINKDANAPIFQQADYQVVGDLYAIVPELTRLLASTTKSS